MKCNIIKIKGTWQDVKDSAMNTIGKESGKEPDSKWKKRILLAEHSPIRQLSVKAQFTNIPYWVAMHFVRHKIGIEHWISTQRTDRTGKDRSELTQDAPVTYTFEANAQAIMSISHKRLCQCASEETGNAWCMFIEQLLKHEPELVTQCVPECIYRGFCPEFNSCGYVNTRDYAIQLDLYREV